MTVSRHTYATREQLKSAGVWETDDLNADADRMLESHSGKVEELLRRRFYPFVETRRYDWPSRSQVSNCILWLDADLLAVTTFTATGTAIASGDYFLGPEDTEDSPPYDRIELDADSTASFGAGGQRALVVAGEWGYTNDEEAAGTLGANIDADDTAATIAITGSIGVGDLIHIGDERMIVADRDGTALTLIRAAYGTTAASHTAADPIYRSVPPGLITDLVIAECIAQHAQEQGGYGVSVGQGGQSTPDRIALLDIRARARDAYARSERYAL